MNIYPVATDPKIVQESEDFQQRKAQAEREWKRKVEEGI